MQSLLYTEYTYIVKYGEIQCIRFMQKRLYLTYRFFPAITVSSRGAVITRKIDKQTLLKRTRCATFVDHLCCYNITKTTSRYLDCDVECM